MGSGNKSSGFAVGGKSGFLGIGGQAGFLNTGVLSSGPQQIEDFGINPQTQEYEQAMLTRQNAIASGQAPSIAQMQFKQNLDANNKAALAMAASQRGASNPNLAFRQAQIGSQQANLEGAQQAAILAEQERRKAEELIAAQAASQRGVAFNQAATNLGAVQQNQQAQMQAISGIGQAMAGKK